MTRIESYSQNDIAYKLFSNLRIQLQRRKAQKIPGWINAKYFTV
jgi:hypothetical protein